MKVTLKPSGHSFEVPAGHNIVQAGLDAGVPAPSANEDSSPPGPMPACTGHPRHHSHAVFDRDGSDH